MNFISLTTAITSTPVEGEVTELLAALDKDGHHLVEVALARECSKTWGLAIRVVRAATLLRQLSATLATPTTEQTTNG